MCQQKVLLLWEKRKAIGDNEHSLFTWDTGIASVLETLPHNLQNFCCFGSKEISSYVVEKSCCCTMNQDFWWKTAQLLYQCSLVYIQKFYFHKLAQNWTPVLTSHSDEPTLSHFSQGQSHSWSCSVPKPWNHPWASHSVSPSVAKALADRGLSFPVYQMIAKPLEVLSLSDTVNMWVKRISL